MKNNRLIHFLGGKTSYYVLGLIILSAVCCLFAKSDFFFIYTLFSHSYSYYPTLFIWADPILSV